MTATAPVALVTGASSGIGRATALALVGSGFTVVGTSRHAGDLKPFFGVTFLDLDVSSDDSVRSVVGDVIEQFGQIDLLVNSAGVAAIDGEHGSIDQAREIFDVNVFGVMRMTDAVLPHMRAQGSGRVVTVTSALNRSSGPSVAVPAATLQAVAGYSESLDHEVRQDGVRMVLVDPGTASTSSLAPGSPLSTYAAQRRISREVLATVLHTAEAPDVVANVIVTASTDPEPKFRYTAGAMASRVSMLRRIVPSLAFDVQPLRRGSLTA